MARTFIAPVSYGLGDMVVSLPAIQALIEEGAPVWLVARAPAQRLLAQRVAGLAGVVDEAELVLGPDDRLVDLRDHSLQRDYWWGSAAFEAERGTMDINQILQVICRDFGIKADFGRPSPLEAYPRRELGGTVLLLHETDGAHKTWPVQSWAALAAGLRADAHPVAQVTMGEAALPLDAAEVPVVVAQTPGQAVDAISGCRAVVGVDTGLAHIAVQQGVPTVVICRRSSVYVRPWPHCAALRGQECTEECIAAENSYAYNQVVSLRDFRPSVRECPSGRPCVAGARPEDALALLRGLL
ncbi:MAG TPA: glycosyltransferase family 9 protein [Acidimicrobiales bacterium]|nr:glycosyltransferase family 9 protein [Acidimicrobiales bacterium]